MAEDKTLLAHLARVLGGKREIIATEALGHILSTSVASKRALEDLLKISGADVGTISNVKTEVKDEELATPDLACFDPHGVERVLIEGKFWAKLTGHQPVTYLERLPTSNPSALLFVAPRKRFETLWADLHREVVNAEIHFGPDNKENDRLWTAEVGGERRLLLTSWENLLDRLYQANDPKDSCAACDIQQLQGLAQLEDKEAFLPIRAEELSPDFPRRVLDLKRLVDDVAVRVSQEQWASKTSPTPSTAGTYYGWYMQLAGAGIWFGYWFDCWAKHRDTPMWVEFSDSGYHNGTTVTLAEVRRKLAPLRQNVPPGIIDEGRRPLVPINLPLGVEYDTVLHAVVQRLEFVARLIGSPDAKS